MNKSNVVRINRYSLSLILAFFLTACSKAEESKKNGSDPVSSLYPLFTKTDATTAYDAFNDVYYDKSQNLYRLNSDSSKDGIAAVWTQAIFWNMAINAYKRTREDKYKTLIDDIYEGNYNHYDHFNWDNPDVWFIYDDIMWWTIAFTDAYEVTKESRYLELAEFSFKRVWSGSPVVGDGGSYDDQAGAMRWGWKGDQGNGYMACINYPTVIAAMHLYRLTQNGDYLGKAEKIYEWARTFIFDLSSGKVADQKNKSGSVDWTVHLYNEATCIGAAVLLYQQTNNVSYLNDAKLAADYVKNNMCDSYGALTVENGVEQGIYTAIFAQYLSSLIVDCKEDGYLDWIYYNIDKAWAHRNANNLTYKDINIVCPKGNVEVYDASACPALMQVIPPK